MQISKPTCEDLLKGNRYHEIVGCPQVVFERVYGNNQSNDHKSKILSTHKAEKADAQKRKRRADEAEVTETAGLGDRKKKQKKIADPAPAGSDDTSGVADVGPGFDAPHELDADYGDQFGAFGVPTEPLADPVTVPGASTEIQTAAQRAPNKIPKSTGSKRTIGDLEDDVDASEASAKKTKAGSRAKASVKSKGRTKVASTAAGKAATSRSSSGSVHPSTRRKTPPVALPRPNPDDVSVTEATPPG